MQPGKSLLLWDPSDQDKFDLDVGSFARAGFPTMEISYERLGRDPDLVSQIREQGVDAVIFTRNDAMPGGPAIGSLLAQARLGYTTLSAIDQEMWSDQTRQCIRDMLSPPADLSFPQPPPSMGSGARTPSGHGTFTLVFDLEQLGGARFGLPRILQLIESRGIQATFFITGFVASVYPSAVERIAAGGHEIGIHGLRHEFLQGRGLVEQTRMLEQNRAQLTPFAEISGANYIYRMDGESPEAFLQAGLRYCLLLRPHLFHMGRFLKPSCRSRRLRTPSGHVTVHPVSVETYSGDALSIRQGLHSAAAVASKEGSDHITILMHPFKDGSLARMGLTRTLVDCLTLELGLEPVRLDSLPDPPDPPEHATEIRYRWHGWEPPPSDRTGVPFRIAEKWWGSMIYHEMRTEGLVDTLGRIGRPAVLTASPRLPDRAVFVHPDHVGFGKEIPVDPLTDARGCAQRVAAASQQGLSATVSPPPRWRDLAGFVLFHLPRSLADLKFLVRRQCGKFASRLLKRVRQ